MKWIKLYENFHWLIVYKGVSPDFDPNKEGPMFFTKDFNLALYYGRDVLRGGVTKWRVNFNNPLIVNAYAPSLGKGHGKGIPMYRNESGDGSRLSDNFIGTFSDSDINQKIQSFGYDGVIIHKKYGDPVDGWEILSFSRDTREHLEVI